MTYAAGAAAATTSAQAGAAAATTVTVSVEPPYLLIHFRFTSVVPSNFFHQAVFFFQLTCGLPNSKFDQVCC